MFLAPEPPAHEGDTPDEDGAADAAEHAAEDLLRRGRQVGPVAAAVAERGFDRGGCVARC